MPHNRALKYKNKHQIKILGRYVTTALYTVGPDDLNNKEKCGIHAGNNKYNNHSNFIGTQAV